MIKVKRPILLKLIIRIGLPILLIYTFILIFNYQRNKQNAISEKKNYLVELSKHNAEKLDKEFIEIAQSAASISNYVESSYPVSEKNMLEFIKKEVDGDPDNIGSGVAFLPNKFRTDRDKYSIFVNEVNGRYVTTDLTGIYNYLNEDWFVIPYYLKRDYWTEPFWGRVSEELIMLNASPVHLDGEIIGVAYADISLKVLSKLSESNKIMDGYTFIISKQGTFIYHPEKDYVMKETVFSLAEKYGKPEIRETGKKMIAGESGIGSFNDFDTNEKKWVVYTPITSTGWSFAAVIPENLILQSVKKMVYKQFWIMLFGLLIILGIIIIVANNFSRPIKKLAIGASDIAEGNLDVKIRDLGGDDEISALGKIFNQMVLDLKNHIENIKSITKSKEAVESEMRIARQIQESLLPRIFPAFPERKEFDLFAKNIPAKEVAGDFYDFFFLDNDILAVIIADVSGKGISAGLFMAVTRTLLKTVCSTQTSPAEALTKANNILCQDNDACMFTTLFLGYYEIKTENMIYSNAGHDYPIIISKDNRVKLIKTKQDIALGIDDEHVYQLDSLKLATEEKLVLYTDGVIEATDQNEQLYGEEKFLEFLKEKGNLELEHLMTSITTELSDFQRKKQFDDITLLLLKRNL